MLEKKKIKKKINKKIVIIKESSSDNRKPTVVFFFYILSTNTKSSTSEEYFLTKTERGSIYSYHIKFLQTALKHEVESVYSHHCVLNEVTLHLTSISFHFNGTKLLVC